MRIATWNILHGLSLPKGTYDVDKFRLSLADLANLDIDVIALQEVDHVQPRTNCDSQFKIASETLNIPHHAYAPALFGTPGEEWQGEYLPGRPQFGNAILSKQEPIATHSMTLKGARFGVPLFIPNQGFIYIKDEPRSVIAMEFNEYVIASTHLSFIPGFNTKQLRNVTQWLNEFDKPALLLGDLNLPLALLKRSTRWISLLPRNTYPSWRPRTQLDYALAQKSFNWGAREVTAPAFNGVSDHRPLILDCEIPSRA